MAQNFRDAHYREVFGINYDVAACGAHLIAAHSKKFNIRYGLCEDSRPGLSKAERSSQRFDQLRAIHLSRRFARRNQYSHASIVTSVDEYNRLWSDGRPRPPVRGLLDLHLINLEFKVPWLLGMGKRNSGYVV